MQRLRANAVPGALALVLICGASASGQTGGGSFGGSSIGTGGGMAGSGGGSGGGLTSTINTSGVAPTLISGTIGNQNTISATGGGGPATSGGTSSVSSGVSTSNIFSATYNNPQAGGLSSASQGGGKFGGPLYGTATTQATTVGTVTVSIVGTSLGTTGGYGGTMSLGTGQGLGPIPVKATAFSLRGSPTTRLHGELRNMFARSSSLSNGRMIDVQVAGGAVLLRGQVADERERRLAENLVWLTPGVTEVRNELRIP
jgi:hypothetical protein